MADARKEPSVRLSIVLFLVMTALVWFVWLYLLSDRWVTLTYGLPLLVCLWHKDKRLLWAMTAAFLSLVALKGLVLMPGTGAFHYVQLGMQGANLLVIAGAVHLVINLTSRLEFANLELAEANRDLNAAARFPAENPYPVMRLDADGRVLYANSSADSLLGEMGMHEGETAPPELRDAARQALRNDQGVELDFECCEGVLYTFTAVPIVAAGYANLYGRDVTRQRRAEAALRESEELFRATFENAAVGVSHIDAHGQLLRANKCLQDMFNYSLEDLAGTGFLAMTWPADRDNERNLYSKLVSGELDNYSIEKRYMRKDGTLRWVLVTRSAQRDETGNFLYSINIVQDISKRKAAEEKLSRYELLAGNTRDVVLFMRLEDGQILEANEAAERAYGYTREEWLGMRIFDLRADDTAAVTADQMREAYEHGILFETEHRRKDGGIFPVEVSSRGALLGDTPTLISIIRDITERKRVEEALRRGEVEARARAAELRELADDLARSNEDLERFAYVVSHDLQEPLRQIVGFADLLHRKHAQGVDETGREFLDFIVEGGKRMQDLIRDLLAFSRVGREMTRKPTSMQAVLESALFNLQLNLQEMGASVTHDPMPQLNVDRGQLVQLFQNLIANSLKFRKPEPPQIHIGCRREDVHWLFFVRDNGIGFRQEQAKKLFQPFRRLHTRAEYEGTGIGLAICKRIVELHGGSIWAEAEEGAGATFYFTLPPG